jgi:superfamily I DNA and/or RNA helicase
VILLEPKYHFKSQQDVIDTLRRKTTIDQAQTEMLEYTAEVAALLAKRIEAGEKIIQEKKANILVEYEMMPDLVRQINQNMREIQQEADTHIRLLAHEKELQKEHIAQKLGLEQEIGIESIEKATQIMAKVRNSLEGT